jgi:hypothetical protein
MIGDTYELWRSGQMIAWMCERPSYCNRGRYHGMYEAACHVSEADPWPRYYFDLEFGKREMELWLKAHRVDTEGGIWRFRPFAEIVAQDKGFLEGIA